jgi:hypothetical protein
MAMRLSVNHVKKTRKDRNCFGCGRLFLKGREMFTHNNIDPPYAFSLHLCPSCHRITDNHWDFASGGENEIYQGFVNEILSGAIPKNPEELLLFLDEGREVFDRPIFLEVSQRNQ